MRKERDSMIHTEVGLQEAGESTSIGDKKEQDNRAAK